MDDKEVIKLLKSLSNDFSTDRLCDVYEFKISWRESQLFRKSVAKLAKDFLAEKNKRSVIVFSELHSRLFYFQDVRKFNDFEAHKRIRIEFLNYIQEL